MMVPLLPGRPPYRPRFVSPGLLFAACLPVVTGACSAFGDDNQPPNIVYIIADDLGRNDVGFYGSEIQTPVLDRLAAESVILDRFYAAPICSPTRAGVLTGCYPFRFGIWGSVCHPRARHGLPPDCRTTPEYLADAGYAQRALFGKWHLGLASTVFHPLRHGFTEFYGHYNGAIDYFSRRRAGQSDWHFNYESVREAGYSTDLIGRASAEWIARRTEDAPFLMVVAFNAPHSPLQAQREDLLSNGFDESGPRAPNTDAGIARREKAPNYGEGSKGNTVRQTFSAMVTALDRNTGLILDALDDAGLRDNTIVIFHSDNGADPKHGGSNLPLRGNKFTTWEGGVRVVAMIRWPARLPGGTRSSAVTGYIDVLPTLLAAADQPIPSDVDGINLLPILTGTESAADRTILLSDRAVVSQQWKLRNGDFYDLSADERETRAAEEVPARIRRALQQRLKEFESLRGPKYLSELPLPENWPPVDWQLPDE